MVEKQEGSGEPPNNNSVDDAKNDRVGGANNANNSGKESERHNSYECFNHEEVKGEVGGTIGTRPQGLSLANQIQQY